MPTKTELDFLKRFGNKVYQYRPMFAQGYTVNIRDQAYFVSFDGYAVGAVKCPDCDIVPRIFSLYGWVDEEEFHDKQWEWAQTRLPQAIGTEYDQWVTLHADNLRTALNSLAKEMKVVFQFIGDSLIISDRKYNVVDEIAIQRFDHGRRFDEIRVDPNYVLGFLRSCKLGAKIRLANTEPMGDFDRPVLFTDDKKFSLYLMTQEKD